MALGEVGNFVCDDGGDLIAVIGDGDEPGMDSNNATGRGKRIQVSVVDQEQIQWFISPFTGLNQRGGHSTDGAEQHGVPIQITLVIDLSRQLTANLFLFKGAGRRPRRYDGDHDNGRKLASLQQSALPIHGSGVMPITTGCVHSSDGPI